MTQEADMVAPSNYFVVKKKIERCSPECLSFSELLVAGLLEDPDSPEDCERCRSLSEKLVEEWIRLAWISQAKE